MNKDNFLLANNGTSEEKLLRLKLLEQESKAGSLLAKKLEKELTDPTHPKFKDHYPLLAKALCLT